MQTTKNNDSKEKLNSDQKLADLIEKMEAYNEQLNQTRQDIESIKENIARLSKSIAESEDESITPKEKETPGYKKALKIIDIIALIIILFIIVDGVFNQFNWLYVISQFITNLF